MALRSKEDDFVMNGNKPTTCSAIGKNPFFLKPD